MAKIEPKHVELALAVRRGQRRIRELAPEDQAPVSAFLRTATDAQMAVLAEGREARTRGRASLSTPHRSWTPNHTLRRG